MEIIAESLREKMITEIFDLENVSDEEIRALQRKQLDILVHFKQFCDEHNLMFYLGGGCLIGAIRHEGFVPWDDDIDIFMPRPDYEKIGPLWNAYGDTKRYTYCRTNEEDNYHHAGASIRDNNTTFINKHSAQEDICHGLGIELLPLDGYPESKIKRGKQIIDAMIFRLFNTQRLPDNKGSVVRFISKLIYAVVPSSKARYRLWRYAEREMSKYTWKDYDYITELTGSIKGMLLKHPKKWFDSSIEKNFEEFKMPVMAGYDEYLTLIFGDYMELPPENERIAKHDVVYINLEKSYKDYKGIYYCTEHKSK